LDTLFAQRSKPRGDELLTHTSDLTGCLRATAYRRRGLTPEPYTAKDQAKFALGHAFEQMTAKTLREAGHDVQEGAEVGASLDADAKYFTTFTDIEMGHPDLILDNELLIECKTTVAGANHPKSHARAGQPREVSVHHAIQAAAYALMLGLKKAVVLVAHYGFEVVEVVHDVDPEQYRAQIERLAHEVVSKTGPDMPLPPAEPPSSDVVGYSTCDYCPWRMCARNPNYDASLLEAELV
jgi:hypothetical protein